jgi:hypothetical protein
MPTYEPRILNPHDIHFWEGNKLVHTLPRRAFEGLYTKRNLEKELNRLGLLPLSNLSWGARKQLKNIPSIDDSGAMQEVVPVSLTLVDRSFLPRAMFVSRKDAWDAWRTTVRASDVASVESSPFTMPERILELLPDETSMSSLEFRVKLKDSSSYACWYSGFNPFTELPAPHDPSDIVDVDIGWGKAHRESEVLIDPDCVWCIVEELK